MADNEDLTDHIEIRRILDNSEARYQRLDEEIGSIIIDLKAFHITASNVTPVRPVEARRGE